MTNDDHKNVDKNMAEYFAGEPPGLRTNAIRWLQLKVMEVSATLPREFRTREKWESYRDRIRRELPSFIGIPRLPPLEQSVVRARVRVGEDALCERVDVYMDGEYAVPCFVFRSVEGKPERKTERHDRRPALVWNPGWPQDKFQVSYQRFALRMASHGFVVLIPDHAPFGETTFMNGQSSEGMTLVMSMGHVLGISQLALRAAETMRCGEYLRSRPDVDPTRVAVAGLCQGGQDTWLSAALDENFCVAAPICAESTFAIHFSEMASYRANGDSSPFPFGILKLCDVEHLHGAIAPRPLLVRGNLGDDWWPVSGFDSVEAFTRRIYRLYGAEDRIDFRLEAHEHDLTGPFAEALEAFLLEQLKER